MCWLGLSGDAKGVGKVVDEQALVRIEAGGEMRWRQR